jgi:hypothetical protein
LIVVVLLTVIGPLYSVPPVSLGVLPSVVYRIDAPVVVVPMVTVCAVVYVPGAGLKVGVDTGAMIFSVNGKLLEVVPLV